MTGRITGRSICNNTQVLASPLAAGGDGRQPRQREGRRPVRWSPCGVLQSSGPLVPEITSRRPVPW